MENTVSIRKSAIGTLAVSALWLVVVLAGMFFLLRYSQAAGLAARPPLQWPGTSLVPRPADRPVLVMFVHPQCPCSSASISELERLMAGCQGRLSAEVLFIQPAGKSEEWARSGLWQAVAAIPGVRARLDQDGAEARRFQALTSGQTLLYDAAGTLQFQGGITLSRGHEGDNPGRSAVAALVRHELSNPAQTPVFGCALEAAETPNGCVACKP